MGNGKESTAPNRTSTKEEANESSAHSCTQTKKEIFLETFRKEGTILHSYKAAGVCRRTIYNWLDDEVFKAAFADAKEDFADLLEEKLYKRLEEAGQNRTNIELLAALKAHRREKWGDNLTVTPQEGVITFKVVRVEVIEEAPKQLTAGSVRDKPAMQEVERITEES